MAFPQVAAVNGGTTFPDAGNHTVNLPAGINAGDLLLIFLTSDGAVDIGFPIGWTQLFESIFLGMAAFCCFYRIADGGEGASINVTTSTDQQVSYTSYRITGYSGVPEAGTTATGNNVNPNPPSLTPSWGAKDTLWFAACGYDANPTVTAYPANYANGRNDVGDFGTSCGIGTARRELNALSDDPGVFTISAAQEWAANTVAVRPLPTPSVGGGGAGGVTGAAQRLLVG